MAQNTAIIAEIEDVLECLKTAMDKCTRKLLRIEEARKVIEEADRKLEKLLPPDSTAFRIYDRSKRECTLWWTETISGYADQDGCKNVEHWVNIVRDVKTELEPESLPVKEQVQMPSIFLSHSWKDKFFARKLAEKLQETEIKVWVDDAELKVGDSFVRKISEAIEQTDYVVVILSHNSISSSWVQKELAFAMTKEIGGRRIIVLPILIEKCDIPDFLKDKVYADFTDPNNFEASFSKLLHAIGVSEPTATVKRKPPKPKPPPCPAPQLEYFEDITITGTDKDRLYKPDLEKALYNVHFTLSALPPQEWVQIFDAERRFPRHTMWRRAWVEARYIVVHCALNEVKEYHLNDIKQDVANTNQKYREYLQQQAIKKHRQRLEEEKEKCEIDDALDGLDFD